VIEEFHDVGDFEEIGKMVKGARRHFLQPFTDRDSVPFGNLHAPSKQDIRKYSEILRKYVTEVGIRGMD
jgi:pyruvate formate lyase activating enzyme